MSDPRFEEVKNKITLIKMPTPKLGAKTYLLKKGGIYVLEPGPGALQAIAVTHAGTGSMSIYDGVPDDRGNFPDSEMLETDNGYYARNGRDVFQMSPILMGMFMLNAGLFHGLTVKCFDGQHGVSTRLTLAWVPYKSALIAEAPGKAKSK